MTALCNLKLPLFGTSSMVYNIYNFLADTHFLSINLFIAQCSGLYWTMNLIDLYFGTLAHHCFPFWSMSLLPLLDISPRFWFSVCLLLGVTQTVVIVLHCKKIAIPLSSAGHFCWKAGTWHYFLIPVNVYFSFYKFWNFFPIFLSFCSLLIA